MAGQLWVTNSLGGYMSAKNLSKELRSAVQPLVKFRQFADVRDAAAPGMHRGSLFHWDVFGDVATAGTVVAETATLPETNYTITQGTLTVGEYGNSVPYTEALDNLSELPVKTIIHKRLKNDATKAFDSAAYAQFAATPLRVVASAGTDTGAVTLYTNGTVTGTNNVALGKNHIKSIVDLMQERNIPGYNGTEDYIAIAHPTTFRQVKNDLEGVYQYVTEGFQLIMNGEIGRYEGVRFVQQTHIAKETFTNGKSNWAYFFGDDTVVEAIVVPEEMRGKIPSDYGRSKGVAWYYLGGFGLVHTDAAQARIVKWDSQA